MKIKNQTGHTVLESAPEKAANDDVFPNQAARETDTPARKPAWSPMEVWRTRVKAPPDRGNSVPR
ncbi:MAG TPA: hypothetical protein VFP37_19290 [Steroidobacteraceae bacterium]|nr:hypothetical protein [Steroidobacteraceae bacterium]